MEKITKTMDGNEAAAYISYAFTDVATIYPITPSTPMAELADLWSANGKKNIFDQEVQVVEMQSEAGASGAMHGSLQAGALTTTYTASQGLLLMIPILYKLSGELLPGVLHVSARAIATHALSILGDHQDVMAVRQTGVALLASSSVQEIMGLGGIAHLAAIKSRVPFLHFFDGFRTSHEVKKVEVMDYQDLAKLLDQEALQQFRQRAMSPEHPVIRGTAQNADIYFQEREAANNFYKAVPDIVENYMQEINKITGRDYHPFNYYGAKDAEYVIVAMGSVCDTIEETVDYLLANGEKVGMIQVHLYRPFCEKYFFNVLPNTVKKIAVLDRTKEPGAPGEPLYLDIRNIFYQRDHAPVIVGGRYGLSSFDTTPTQIIAVFNNLKTGQPRNNFTIGIEDDLTHLSLEVPDFVDTTPEGTIQCKFWGLGSDGTVGANKMAIKIIGDHTNLYAQGYFSYDSKKSGGTTISYLRFGNKPIKSSYLIYDPSYIACHNKSYVNHYDLLEGIRDHGTFVLNCPWKVEELSEKLNGAMKRALAQKHINFYIIDAVNIAREIGLGGRINMVMQAVFFKLAQVIPVDQAIDFLKASIKKTYGTKGQKIIDMNKMALDRGMNSLVRVDVPESWANAPDEAVPLMGKEPDFVRNIQRPMADLEGYKLPVSAFGGMEDGTFPPGTTAYEKRGIAVMVPEWQTDKCIQCNQCAYICPHAVIRPFLLDANDKEKAPETFETKEAKGKDIKGYEYRIQISPLDCTGCGNCADICPAPGKALVMVDAEEEIPQQIGNWEYAVHNLKYRDQLTSKKTLFGSQFAKPLLEFSGACAGCGETAYLKLVTQLYGDRMIIANATGCSSIWGASAPSTAFTTNEEGRGPSWANSLFEDNAEFGYGLHLGASQIREQIHMFMTKFIQEETGHDIAKKVFGEWIEGMFDGETSRNRSDAVLSTINNLNMPDHPILKEIIKRRDYLVKRSQWIVGGDGWAYDIGYGGVDQVLAMGGDVNLLVFDTEVYSNTGGQASKSTPTASYAKFAASGKKIKKKDLGMMAMSYGYVYVTQIAMGANMIHTIKAIQEAESYPGPSLIICYAPCINHGIRSGMGTSVAREKEAVEAGYWHLYRYDPRLKAQGKNPFMLDSKEPTKSFHDFIMGELRYSQIQTTFPDHAEVLYQKAGEDAKERYDNYRRMSEMVF